MYRQVFTPNEQDYLVSIPHQWYGREVEVLVFPTYEAAVQPTANPRHYWAEAAQRAHLAGDDAPLMSNTLNAENTDWWTWYE